MARGDQWTDRRTGHLGTAANGLFGLPTRYRR